MYFVTDAVADGCRTVILKVWSGDHWWSATELRWSTRGFLLSQDELVVGCSNYNCCNIIIKLNIAEVIFST